MNIAIWHNLPSGGGKRALFNHVRALLEAGHSLEGWTTDFSDGDYLPLSDLIPEHRKEIRNAWRKAHSNPYPIKRERLVHEVLTQHYRACLEEMDGGGFDLIFANSCAITYMPYIGSYTDKPTLLYLGEPFRRLYEALPTNIWAAPYERIRLRKIRRMFNDYQRNYANRVKVSREIRAARSYDRILVNSLFSRENVLRAYGVEAQVSYLGVDTGTFSGPEKPKEAYVAGMGTLGSIKGVHNAIEIIARIPEGIRPPLKWIANGSEAEYQQKVTQLAETRGVDFQPFIGLDERELVDMLSRAAVMVYTSKLEPFGLAPLEANACGTYVIANAEGGIRESISDPVNGTLVLNNDPETFAKEVEGYISDLEKARDMGIRARDHVREHWDLKKRSEQFVAEIEGMQLT